MDEEPSIQRRLAAILAADIAGYSRLMHEDEPATVRDLKAHQSVILPLIGRHGGRIIDTAGDGIMAEFPSVIGATECAVEIQTVMAERNQRVPESRRMRFRIGINLGDVIHDETRIYGDGINIAARLEALAPAGWRARFQYRLRSGPRQAAVHLRGCGRAAGQEHRAARANVSTPHPGRILQGRGHARQTPRPHGPQALDCVGPGGVPGSPRGGRSLVDGLPVLSQVSTEAPRLSIVVLPFSNLSGDPSQDYFADGITEDLTSDLSRIAGSFVISRNTAFTFKGKAVDARQIGRELGVRYVLEGSVRRMGGTVRVNAQLIDAGTGAHLWAEQMDVDQSTLATSRTTSASRTDLQGCSVSSSSMSRAAGRRAPTRMRWTSPCVAGPS